MTTETPETKVDWTRNCLTPWVHHGREGELWSIPLRYAVVIFRRAYLRDLVIERIYADAMQFVEHHSNVIVKQVGTGMKSYIYTQEWADAVRARAEQMYDNLLQQKVGEIVRYYDSSGWELEQQEMARRVKEGTLTNTAYAPLHDHDTINMICRIMGVSAMGFVQKESAYS